MGNRFRILAVLMLAVAASAWADPDPAPSRRGRFFQAEPGYMRAKDLPEDFRTRIDTVRFAI